MKRFLILNILILSTALACSSVSSTEQPSGRDSHESVSEKSITEFIADASQNLPDIETLKGMKSLRLLDLSAFPYTDYSVVESFRQALPECVILWNQQLTDGAFRSDSTDLVLPNATAEDIRMLAVFTNLKSVDASGSAAYPELFDYQQQHPGTRVLYTFESGETCFSNNDREAMIHHADAESVINAIRYFPAIEKMDLTDSGWSNEEIVSLLHEQPDLNVHCVFQFDGQSVGSDADLLDLRSCTELTSEMLVKILGCFLNLDTIVLPQTWNTEDIQTIKSAYPALRYAESFTVYGTEIEGTATEVDLSGNLMQSADEAEDVIRKLPFLSRMILCECGLSNEQMETLCNTHPDIRFVWTIEIGKRKLRTDALGFSTLNPSKYQNPKASKEYNESVKKAVRLYEGDIEQLKYCVDLEALDLGHNYLTNEDLVIISKLTNLKVLILADNKITDISSLTTLKNLEYIELFMNKIPDLSPLCEMPSLVDVNVCNTGVSDLSPLFHLTGVSRLWYAMNPFDRTEAKQLKESLPDCECNYTTRDETGDGWRDSPRYRWMRSYFVGD